MRPSGSTRTPFISERSITRAPSAIDKAGEGVSTAAYGDRQTAGPPELHAGDDIRNSEAANDHRRMPVDRAVPDLAIRVIARISRVDDVPAESRPINLLSIRCPGSSLECLSQERGCQPRCGSIGYSKKAFPFSVGTRENAAMEEIASAAEVHVALLGGFSVTVNGQPVPDRWRLRKAKTLVKLLALAPGHRLHRDIVSDSCGRIASRRRQPTTCIRSCTPSGG